MFHSCGRGHAHYITVAGQSASDIAGRITLISGRHRRRQKQLLTYSKSRPDHP